jgi:N-acetyl-anhydromuramyl-L-alanine amidase AmpD
LQEAPLYDGGASAHYTIKQNGYQDQHHLDSTMSFMSGASSWKGIPSVNTYSIGIMLIHDAKSPFSETQINKTIALINDINARHNTTMEVVGLGEINLKHIAPGKLFPWDKLADNGIGTKITFPDTIEYKCTLLPYTGNSKNITDIKEKMDIYSSLIDNAKVAFSEDNNTYVAIEQSLNNTYNSDQNQQAISNYLVVTQIQQDLKAHGYSNIVETGIYDEITNKIVTVFNDRYVPNVESNCWSDASQYAIDQLLGKDSYINAVEISTLGN